MVVGGTDDAGTHEVDVRATLGAASHFEPRMLWRTTHFPDSKQQRALENAFVGRDSHDQVRRRVAQCLDIRIIGVDEHGSFPITRGPKAAQSVAYTRTTAKCYITSKCGIHRENLIQHGAGMPFAIGARIVTVVTYVD